MSDPDLHVPPVPWRSGRAWVSLLAGVVLVGIGLGTMIAAGLGVGPADAFFTGAARISGLTVGTTIFLISIVMVLGSWALGVAPAIGTLVSFVGISVVIDLWLALLSPLAIGDWPWWSRGVTWGVGLLLFSAGVLGLFGSHLGVSPYDQVVRAVAYRTGRSLGFARFVVDALAFVGALLLGGSWGIGTVVVLLTVPFVLNLALPRYQPWVLASAEAGRAHDVLGDG